MPPFNNQMDSPVEIERRNSEPGQSKIKPLPEYLSRHYDKLPTRPDNRGAIRLLNLISSDPNNPNVECELITPKDDPSDPTWKIPYEALSWCWGAPDRTQYIRIRKGQKTYAKYVSANLFSALRALRDDQNNRHLWIDAVCIDQENLDEKNHQVEMMDKIYGNADRVCIWLGDATKSSRLAIRFIEEEVLRLRNFDELCESAEASSKWGALLKLMQRPWFSRRWVVQEIALARQALIYCGTDTISWNKFAIAVELFVEVETATHRLSEVMQKDPKYYHVPGWFEYVSALGASLLVDATGRLFRDSKEEQTAENTATDGDESDSDVQSDSDYGSDADSTSSSVNDISHRAMPHFRRLKRATEVKKRGLPLLSLEYLVSSLSIFGTSGPHDTIYALLAIAKDTTPIAANTTMRQSSDHAQHVLEVFTQRKRYKVDYKLPYVDVCQGFIQFCIERSLQSDRSRALDVICRPWATEEKVLEQIRRAEERERKRERKRQERETPGRNYNTRKVSSRTVDQLSPEDPYESPTFETPRKSNTLYSDNSKVVEFEEAKAKELSLPSWVPQLTGAPFGMYEKAGIDGITMSRKNADPLVGLSRTTHKTYTAAETKSVDMKALKFRKRTDLGHYSMYVRGFVLDNIAEVSQISRNGQIPQEWAELGGWSGARKNPPEEFWRTLVADRGKDDKNPPVYYSRACKESFKKGGFRGGAVNTTELINFERNSVVAQFCRRVQAVTWNRALVKTEKGQRLGLVNKNVEKGDRVCILYGCSVPVILRQSKHKTDAQFNEEMEWELRFLAGTLCQYYRQYRERVRKHGQRKAEAKERYAIWDLQKLKMWQRDQEWRRRWRQKLMLEGEDERNEGLDIKRLYEIPDVSELEKTSQAYRKHLQHLIWNQDLRLGREFNAWKREKRVSAKNLVHSDWVGPPVLNWREFELRLKYGRLWKKTITDRKEAIRKRVEAEWRNQTRKPNRPSRTAAKSALTNHHSPPMQDSEILNASSLGTDVFTQPPNGIGKKAAPPIPPPKMKQSGHVYLPGYVNGNLPSPLPKKHLSPSEASEYDQKIRRNFKARLGEDGLYSYELLGESYIHGMMDGEAMAYQNKEGIKTTVFELR